MGRMIGKALLCGLAGLAAWMLSEPFMPKNLGADWGAAEQRMVFLGVAFIGLAAGLFQGMQKGGKTNILLMSAMGFVFGAVGGLLGYSIGGGMMVALFGPNVFNGGSAIPVAIAARMVAMAPLGAFLGAAIGGTQMSGRAVVSGALGGFIGGMVGGAVFDIIGASVGSIILLTHGAQSGEVGGPSRAIMFTLLGFTVGLFTAIMDLALRQAWVRLVLGRNEGKEWVVDHAQTNIGRDERAHIPLFGDANVAPLHAMILQQQGAYFLQDAGSPMGTGLNGSRIAQVMPLNPGDIIMVGSHQLQFLMKHGAAQRAQEGRARAMAVGAPGMAQPGQVPAAPLRPVTQGVQATQPFNPAPASSASMPAGMSAQGVSLVALNGPLMGQRFPVAVPFDVGREGGSIPLSFDTQASRRHAQVAPSPGGATITDLGSTNGTYVNGQRVTQAYVKTGDNVRIGSTEFRVE